jgi:uncharacterized membrane protein YcaP (DUF421 family)
MPSWFADVDWKSLFALDTPVLEIVVRGSIMYLALFALLRLLIREAGAIGITDLLVVVLLADAAQNAMAGEYRSVTDGLILVMTIVLWALALDWLGYRVPRVRRLVHPPPLPLVRDGRILRRNLAKELMTEDELKSQLRQRGVSDLSQVVAAYMEGDGHISVIRRDDGYPHVPEHPIA